MYYFCVRNKPHDLSPYNEKVKKISNNCGEKLDAFRKKPTDLSPDNRKVENIASDSDEKLDAFETMTKGLFSYITVKSKIKY